MRKAWFAVLVGMFLLGTPLVANAQKGEYVIDRLDPNSPPSRNRGRAGQPPSITGAKWWAYRQNSPPILTTPLVG